MLIIIYSSYIFLIGPLLEARAEMQNYFRSFFGSNEKFRICFWDLLTFSDPLLALKDVKKIDVAIFFPPDFWTFRRSLVSISWRTSSDPLLAPKDVEENWCCHDL